VAKDIAKNLYTSFRGTLYFSEDFLACPSWSYESVCNGKQFEIDLIAKVGRNGHDSEDLILPDFFYSISGNSKIEFRIPIYLNNILSYSNFKQDNASSKQDPDRASHLIVYEITSNPNQMQNKLEQLERNIEALLETNVITDLGDIFIAGVATKRRLDSKDLEKYIMNLPLLKELNSKHRLFFVHQPEGTLEQLPDMFDNIDIIKKQLSELPSMKSDLSELKLMLDKLIYQLQQPGNNNNNNIK